MVYDPLLQQPQRGLSKAQVLALIGGGPLPPPGAAGNILISNGVAFVTHQVSCDATLASTGCLTLATVNANVGTFGNATNVGQFTVNAKGLITAAANVPISDIDTSSASSPVFFPEDSGDESIVMPGPAGATGSTGSTGATGAAGTNGAPGFDGVDGEDSLVPGPQGATGPAGANGTSGAAGAMGPPGMAGEDGESNVLDGFPPEAPNGVVAGTYGDATHVASFSVDQYGDVTAVSSVLITQSPVTGGGPTDPLNFWFMLEPNAGTASTSYTVVGPASISATTNSTFTAVSDTTGIYGSHSSAAGSGVNAGVTTNAAFIDSQNKPRCTFKMKTDPTSLADQRIWVGMMSIAPPNNDTPGSSSAAHGAAFRFSSVAGDTKWQAVTFNGATQTVADTGVTVTTATRFDLVIDFANFPTNILFYVNGVLKVTATATLPTSTTALQPAIRLIEQSGNARAILAAKIHIVGQT
jgi:hypothetical protein